MKIRGRVLVGALAVLVVAVLATAAIIVLRRADGPGSKAAASAADTATAPYVLKPLPHANPGFGWRISLKDISPTADSLGSRLGAVGNRAFFHSEGDSGKSWVYAIDLAAGTMAFPVVELDKESPDCLLNGPSVVLCLDSDFEVGKGLVKSAWVIDTDTGEVSYHGPTDIEYSQLDRIGQYAVGRTDGQGWWGVGAKAERTWQVPGSGNPLDDNTAPTLPPQRLVTAGDDHKVVFSVIDGRILSRDAGAQTQVYPGGYVDVANDSDAARFYDESGALLNTVDGHGGLSVVSAPGSESVVLEAGGKKWLLVDRTGTQYAAFDAVSRVGTDMVRVVGGRLLAADYGDTVTQYDPKTGATVNKCSDTVLGDLVGTDGTVFLFTPLVGSPARAVDLDSCKVLWEFDTENRRLFAEADTVLIGDDEGITTLASP